MQSGDNNRDRRKDGRARAMPINLSA